MNRQDPLSQLRDIHLPAPVGWWPPAPGWWFILFAAIAIFAVLACFWRRRFVKKRYRRIAVREMALLRTRDTGNIAAVLVEVSALLRRVAIQTFGRQEVARLSGDAWLSFLDRTGRTSGFSSGAAKVLGSDIYRPAVEADIKQVLDIAEKWIREHRQC